MIFVRIVIFLCPLFLPFALVPACEISESKISLCSSLDFDAAADELAFALKASGFAFDTQQPGGVDGEYVLLDGSSGKVNQLSLESRASDPSPRVRLLKVNGKAAVELMPCNLKEQLELSHLETLRRVISRVESRYFKTAAAKSKLTAIGDIAPTGPSDLLVEVSSLGD